MKRHRLKGEDCFAGFCHRFNFILESARRTDRAKLADGVDQDGYGVCVCGCDPANAADKAGAVHVRTSAPDGNNVTGCSDTGAGCIAQGDVVGADGVVKQRFLTDGRVEAAGGVEIERSISVGRVLYTYRVAKERTSASARVEAADGVAKERINTVGRVVEAGGVAKERSKTVGRVVGAGDVAKEGFKTVGRVAAAFC